MIFTIHIIQELTMIAVLVERAKFHLATLTCCLKIKLYIFKYISLSLFYRLLINYAYN